MRLILAAVGFVNEDIEYNKKRIIDSMAKYAGRADMVIFGEAFLQGFYGVNFEPDHDSNIAVEKDSALISDLCFAAKKNSIGVSFGFIEIEDGFFYSSQITIDKKGNVIDLYRRVSPGWKEKTAGDLYREGQNFHSFAFLGKRIAVVLCGDLWYEKNVQEIKKLKPDCVWWPVYTDYNFQDWNTSIKFAYADQAAKVGRPVLYVNSVCLDKADEQEIAKGGASYFENKRIILETPAGLESELSIEL